MYELFFAAIAIAVITLIIWMMERKQKLKLEAILEEYRHQVKDLKLQLQLKDNKRNAYRLHVTGLSCVIRISRVQDSNYHHLAGTEVEGKILDISAKGIRTGLDLDVPIRKKIYVDIIFSFKEEEFKVEGVFVRKEEYMHQSTHLVYGIQFGEMEPKERERLQLLINYTQAERHKS